MKMQPYLDSPTSGGVIPWVSGKPFLPHPALTGTKFTQGLSCWAFLPTGALDPSAALRGGGVWMQVCDWGGGHRQRMSITIIIVTQTPTHLPLLEPSLCQAKCMAPKYRDVRNLFSLYLSLCLG